ncbi:unnamed protein product [Amoebophrya sp. A120]|nr:unnamed protein product [Amoebophrya sp. A120]|eukprot:GSA120T00026218001.1
MSDYPLLHAYISSAMILLCDAQFHRYLLFGIRHHVAISVTLRATSVLPALYLSFRARTKGLHALRA